MYKRWIRDETRELSAGVRADCFVSPYESDSEEKEDIMSNFWCGSKNSVYSVC